MYFPGESHYLCCLLEVVEAINTSINLASLVTSLYCLFLMAFYPLIYKTVKSILPSSDYSRSGNAY